MRPEALRPLPRNADPSGAPLLSIDVAQHLGHETLLDASSGPHRIVARVSATDNSRIGEKRPFLFEPGLMHVFDPETGENLCVSFRPLPLTPPSSLPFPSRMTPHGAVLPIGCCGN